MRTHSASFSAAVVSAALLGGAAGQACASPDRYEAFEQAIQQAYKDIQESGQALRHKPPEKAAPRQKDILKTSERVFSASPEAARDLAHLRHFVTEQVAAEAGEPGQREPARDLLSTDDTGLAALVGISVFWHEAQHHYDRAASYREGISHLGIELPMPIEMERRGWEAGCRFWKSGIGVLLKADDKDWPKAYYCEDKFPQAYYCKLYFAEEIVVMTARQLQQSGRSRAQVIEDLSPQAHGPGDVPAPAPSPFERVLGAYCGEFERAESGNPLDLQGFSFRWSAQDCLARALSRVLDPAWKSSADLCASSDQQGSDIRALAREVKDWK